MSSQLPHKEASGLARFVCYDEKVICATLVCASSR
jgi:hypothetical protein